MSGEKTRAPALLGPVQYEVQLSDEHTICVRELTSDEFESLFLSAPVSGGGAGAAGWDVTQRGVRMFLVSDNGQEVKYSDLAGALLGQRFRPRELLLLREVFTRLHMPGEEDLSRVKVMRVIAPGGT